jgi:hypothetical protein
MTAGLSFGLFEALSSMGRSRVPSHMFRVLNTHPPQNAAREVEAPLPPPRRVNRRYSLIMGRRSSMGLFYMPTRHDFIGARRRERLDDTYRHTRVKIVVDRLDLYKSCKRALKSYMSSTTRISLNVHFKDEKGDDYGGLRRYTTLSLTFRELFTLLAREFTKPERGILKLTDEGLAELNPRSHATEGDFKFLGFIIGLAINNREVFPITFVPTFYKQLLKQNVIFKDLAGVDAQLYHNLISLRYIRYL